MLRIPLPMMFEDKIIAFESAAATFEALRARGLKLVQCHGTFDLLHPGHIHHLEEARTQGDVLVVTLTGEAHVNKGPGRPCFNDQHRAYSLSALGCVDYVVLIPHAAAVEAIEAVRPAIYCKGVEYADPAGDPTGNIADDVATVKRFGGEVRYLGSVVFSSTKLLNNHFDNLRPKVKAFCREVAADCPPEKFREYIDGFASLKVLLIGDTIFDRYTTVKVQGLTSKNRILSGRFLGEEIQSGGALAVYRHMRQFCPHVRFISLAGPEPWADEVLREQVDPDDDWIIRAPEFVTIVKQRYVEPATIGKELIKLFSVNFMNDTPPSTGVQSEIYARIEDTISNFDLVVVADFGHGLLQNDHRILIQERAPFMSLNCQTNSNNHGFNIVTRQYSRADAFSLDEQEMLLACGRKYINHLEELEVLRSRFSAGNAWLTRGVVETLGIDDQGGHAACEPLETTVLDTIGAGDAFFSVASLAAAARLPIAISTLIGQLAGGQAVKVVGNRQPISKSVLVKSGMALLNF